MGFIVTEVFKDIKIFNLECMVKILILKMVKGETKI